MSLIDWPFLIKSFLFSVILICTGITTLLVGPALEARLWPVVDIMVIDRIAPINGVSSQVWTSFHKLRPCEYLGTSWYHMNGDGSLERVGLTLAARAPNDTSPPTRPLGYFHAGPWTVTMPADQIRDQSLVEVFHRCNLLWITQSHFYP